MSSLFSTNSSFISMKANMWMNAVWSGALLHLVRLHSCMIKKPSLRELSDQPRAGDGEVTECKAYTCSISLVVIPWHLMELKRIQEYNSGMLWQRKRGP